MIQFKSRNLSMALYIYWSVLLWTRWLASCYVMDVEIKLIAKTFSELL